jgi:hypothetical protein
MTASEKLGRFGHHPDPAIDFCVEVEIIENEWLNNRIGFENGTPLIDELRARLDKALSFIVGGDLNAISAKAALRRVDAEMKAPGVDFEEIERLARSASPSPQHLITHPRDHDNWKANEAFQREATPELILHLIDRDRLARAFEARMDDWTASDTETAEAILDFLGIGRSASREPGADWRRDRIAQMFRARNDRARVEGEKTVFFRLTWEESGDAGFLAETPIGHYEMHKVGFVDVEEWELTSPFESLGMFPVSDIGRAREKAQKDFETRVSRSIGTVSGRDAQIEDQTPRYTTKRLRDEIEKARRAGIEAAATWHLVRQVDMDRIAGSDMAKSNGIADICKERANWHRDGASEIRKLS